MSESFALELVDLVYRAAQEASGWRVFLETLSRATGGAALAMSLSLPDLALPQYQFRAHQRADLCFALTNQMQRGLIWGSLDAPVYRQRFVRQSVEREALLANDLYRGARGENAPTSIDSPTTSSTSATGLRSTYTLS